MTFFENQLVARRKTTLLLSYFVLAVVFIILAVYIVSALLFTSTPDQASQAAISNLWNPDLFITVAIAVLCLVSVGSLYKVIVLASGGGKRVAESLGGEPILPGTKDPTERQLLNIVEEVAIASGVPVPPVYLLKHEQGINAFAAGFSIDDAVIGVTAGTVHNLNRDELQGVIAHEYSHIINGDMRLNLRLIGVLHGILLIGTLGYFLLRSGFYASHARSRSSNNNSGQSRAAIAIFGLALVVIGYIGVFFGKLIKAAVSRQREFLADASAVQFTRNPKGIAGALKKIAQLVSGSKIEHRNAEEASHLFFSNGLSQAFLNLLATHPPILERIKKIDPSFDGSLELESASTDPGSESVQNLSASELASGFSAAAGERFSITPDTVAKDVGMVSDRSLNVASKILNALPPLLLENAREPFGARLIIYLLLLDKNPEISTKQLKHLKLHETAPAYVLLSQLITHKDKITPAMRLALVDLTLPALKLLSSAQYLSFKENLKALANADNELSLFEYTLHHILVNSVDKSFKELQKAKHFSTVSESAKNDAAKRLISILALESSNNPELQNKAFTNGMAFLGSAKPATITTKEEASLEGLDRALSTLKNSDISFKEKLVKACTAAISADGTVTTVEAEILRVVGAALDCPIPPLLPA